MQDRLILILVLFLAFVFARTALPVDIVTSVCSETGKEIIDNAEFRAGYSDVMIEAVTQNYESFSGIAVSVAMLNSLNITAPPYSVNNTFPYFTQENFFAMNSDPDAYEITRVDGITLQQLNAQLTAWEYGYYTGSKPKIRQFQIAAMKNGTQFSKKQMEKDAIAYLGYPSSRIIVNFDRNRLFNLTNPSNTYFNLLAYNYQLDTYLLLDPERYHYTCPCYWVNGDDLFQAMNATSSFGYILINPPPIDHTGDREETHIFKIISVITGVSIYACCMLFSVFLLLCAFISIFKHRKRHVVINQE